MKNIIAVIATTIIASSAFAQSTGTLTYRGSINDRCSLSGFADGVIVVNVDGTTLSSTETGGAAARVNAQTNAGNFRLVFGTPTLTGPAGTVSGVTFGLSSSATGTNNGGQPIGPITSTTNTLQLAAPGAYSVTVNASAATTQTLASGSYTLQVPVSCTK